MAIQYNNARGEFGPRLPGQPQRKPVTRDLMPVTRDTPTDRRIEALEREVVELRKMIADLSAPSTNKRAAYMREYRKRAKV